MSLNYFLDDDEHPLVSLLRLISVLSRPIAELLEFKNEGATGHLNFGVLEVFGRVAFTFSD